MPAWKVAGTAAARQDEKVAVPKKTLKEMRELEANGIHRDPQPQAPAAKLTPVVLNVYNLVPPPHNTRFSMFGVGIYHSGVVVHGKEYSFGGSSEGADGCGIFNIPPRAALPPSMFHSSVPIGDTPLAPQQVAWILNGMGRDWTMRSYSLLGKNCNHFSEEFIRRLGAASKRKYTFPAWVNRAAKLGDTLIPSSLMAYILKNLPQPPPEAAPPPAPSHASQCHNCANCRQHKPAAAAEAEGEVKKIPIPEDLAPLTVRQLRTIMFVHGISWQGCVEKSDMVTCIKEHVAAKKE
ncbi:DeSI-like protein [Diplonema papillatum]|nr:DeSI-like protein [Diplonema papillatum]